MVDWYRFPLVFEQPYAQSWLTLQSNLGLARNTIEAYGRGLQDFFRFIARDDVAVLAASRADIARYVRDLSTRPNPRGPRLAVLDSGAGLANATLQQRITAVRLFYDFLVEQGIRADNPVGRGEHTPWKGFGGARARGLVPRYRKLPWIPTDEQWQAILASAGEERLRNRFMLALGYDAALRREELCQLRVDDFDPAHRLVRVRAETSKGRRERVVPYSEASGLLLAAYLQERRSLSRERGPLFRSASDRNLAKPITVWTWSKVTAALARRSGVPRFTTHTLRHLRLTDLARAGWDIHELATFAGHSSIQSTLQYIHLSGRELAAKLQGSMDHLHAQRLRTLMALLP